MNTLPRSRDLLQLEKDEMKVRHGWRTCQLPAKQGLCRIAELPPEIAVHAAGVMYLLLLAGFLRQSQS
jgi:hypothetical protein